MYKAKYKVGDLFIVIKESDKEFPLNSYVEIKQVVEPNQRPKLWCGIAYSYTFNEYTYVFQGDCYTMQLAEHLVTNLFKKTKRRWCSKRITWDNVSTAVFEYLEKRGFNPNRKRGLKQERTIGGFPSGNFVVDVEERSR